MVIYIPNALFDECHKSDENMEEFIRNVFREWYCEYFIDSNIVERAIEQISLINKNFTT